MNIFLDREGFWRSGRFQWVGCNRQGHCGLYPNRKSLLRWNGFPHENVNTAIDGLCFLVTSKDLGSGVTVGPDNDAIFVKPE